MEKVKYPSFKVQIGGYNKEDGVVTYNMRVLSTGEHSFHIVDRYRNMRSFAEDVKKDAPNPDKIPDFPPKKWLGNKSREFLETRKCGLEIYFNTLLDSPDKVIFSHAMRYFKKLAKTREAKDALQDIEEMVASRGQGNKPQEESKRMANNVQVQQRGNEDAKGMPGAANQPAKTNIPGMNMKYYSESANKIVENFNKKFM